MEEAAPHSELPQDAEGAITQCAPVDQVVEGDHKHDDHKRNSNSGSNLELFQQIFTGDTSTKGFCFTQKCIPCHRCSGDMRLCMRKVRYKSIVKILECDTCGWISAVNKTLSVDGNYPTYRCTRKNCQTFCSPRTLTRRLRNVAYDKLRNREMSAEISPQAKQQLLVAFGTCLAATSDGSPTSYSTERAKLARDKLAARAVSEATVLLRAMLADDNCSISLALKTAIRDLSSVLSCFSNIPINGSGSQKSKLKKELCDELAKTSTVGITPSKNTNGDRESSDRSPSAVSDELSATMETDLDGSTSPGWVEWRGDRFNSISPTSDVDMTSVVGCRKSCIPRLSTRPWLKVSKFSSSFIVTVVQYAGWETVETLEVGRAVGDNQITCPTSAINGGASVVFSRCVDLTIFPSCSGFCEGDGTLCPMSAFLSQQEKLFESRRMGSRSSFKFPRGRAIGNTESATLSLPKDSDENCRATGDSVDTPNESTAREVFNAIAL